VLRLLYSNMARGTAVKKSAWSYARGSRDRAGRVSGRVPSAGAANFLVLGVIKTNGLPPIRRIGSRPSLRSTLVHGGNRFDGRHRAT